MSFFTSIEFFVIMAFIAAAVVALAAMPSKRGAARMFYYGGELDSSAAPSVPGVVALVDEQGQLLLYRFGLDGVSMDGAYSLAVTITGFDVTIDERLTAGQGDTAATSAVVRCDCFGRERYHFHFRSEATGRSAAFTLNIRPGNRIERRLE
ncbi:MAG: hypothetical protein K2L84_02820 [Muribaculaceae bacterium]|nr:hypothetical protein [Muribaculaceae bacterium]